MERLIEGGFARLFRGTLHPREVAVQLLHAIEDHIESVEDGRDAAPTRYVVHFAPQDLKPLLKQTADLSSRLARHVVTYCQENDLVLAHPPRVVLVEDVSVPPGTVQVTASHETSSISRTQILSTVPPTRSPSQRMPHEAQLIVDGKRNIPLAKEFFTIGRHPDNDLVLDDVHVSRHHVQIRLRNGRFTLYDRQSKAGTRVNGQHVNEHILSPGDVIQIGGISILYTEEETDHALNDTQIDMLPPDLPEGSTL
ncbi:MAG: hypothetical protein Kow0077_05020 [Anaerolineae bacterium]